jgi:hypothetical protein
MSYKVLSVENGVTTLEYLGEGVAVNFHLLLPTDTLDIKSDPPNHIAIALGGYTLDVGTRIELIPYQPTVIHNGQETETPGNLPVTSELPSSPGPLGSGHRSPELSPGTASEDAGELQLPDAGTSKAVRGQLKHL